MSISVTNCLAGCLQTTTCPHGFRSLPDFQWSDHSCGRERCQSLFSSRSPTLYVVIADTPASINSQLLKLEGQFVLFLYSVRIEIKREFPFKLYLRNVNQPGIWGLINFHFPNQIYTIQAVLSTLHLGSWVVVSKLGSSRFLCLLSWQILSSVSI